MFPTNFKPATQLMKQYKTSSDLAKNFGSTQKTPFMLSNLHFMNKSSSKKSDWSKTGIMSTTSRDVFKHCKKVTPDKNLLSSWSLIRDWKISIGIESNDTS